MQYEKAFAVYGEKMYTLSDHLFPAHPDLEEVKQALGKMWQDNRARDIMQTNTEAIPEWDVPKRTVFHNEDFSIQVIYIDAKE